VGEKCTYADLAFVPWYWLCPAIMGDGFEKVSLRDPCKLWFVTDAGIVRNGSPNTRLAGRGTRSCRLDHLSLKLGRRGRRLWASIDRFQDGIIRASLVTIWRAKIDSIRRCNIMLRVLYGKPFPRKKAWGYLQKYWSKHKRRKTKGRQKTGKEMVESHGHPTHHPWRPRSSARRSD